MPPALPNNSDQSCCNTAPCVPDCTPIPGIQGPAGASGEPGTNGQNAYTLTTALFVQPAIGNTVAVSVVNGLWVSVGQHVYVSSGGDYIVDSAGATSLVLENTGAQGNASPATNIASAQTVSASGVEGPAGSLTGPAGGDLTGTYPDPELTNTGVSPGTWTKVTVDAKGRVTTGANLDPSDIPTIDLTSGVSGELPIANGGTGQATQIDAFNALSPLTTTGDLLTHDGTNNIRLGSGSSFQSLRTISGVPTWYLVSEDLLGASTVDANTTGDSPIIINAASYIIRRIVAYNASISLTTVAGGIYTATGKGGNDVVAAGQSYAALTASSKFLDLSLNSVALTDVLNSATLYFSPTTPQGSAATLIVQVYGERIS